MTYLQIHMVLGGAALFMLSRSVNLMSLAGIISAVACVLLGPAALAAVIFVAVLSASDDVHHTDRRAHDAEFYKRRHDRRHH